MQLREKDHTVFVDTYAMDVYLPAEYVDKEYRGHPYYEAAGTKVKFYGVGNMRFYNTEKEFNNPETVSVSTLGIPMIITSTPTEIDVRDVTFAKGAPARHCIVLTYYKDDVFMELTSLIQSSTNVMILMALIDGGKITMIPPDDALKILQDVQSMNGVKLRIPPEMEELLISERYRDPENHYKKARLSDNPDPNKLASLNMRREAMSQTTYQAITHEDINSALISSINRKRNGIVDPPTTMERIVRGMSTEDLEADRDKRREE